MAVDVYALHRPRHDLLVLCYHAISEDWPSPLAVGPDVFRAQIQALLARGYVGATFADAMTHPPGAHTFVITFDDAYESVRALAEPVLTDLGVPATVFVPTDLVDLDGPMSWPGVDHWLGTEFEPELQGMGWDGVQAMADAGWEVGSHTRVHPRLTQLGDDELHAELEASRLAVEERLDRPCPSIAYPYGDVDARVMRAAAAAGYRFGALLPDSRDRWPAVSPLGCPRVGVYPGTTPQRFMLETSPLLRKVRGTAVLGPLVVAGRVKARARRRSD